MRSINLGLVALLGCLGGCASVAEGTVDASQPILLTSSPSGARVTQQQRTLCETPCQVRQGQLRYGEPFTFSWANGQAMTVDPKMQVNGGVLGNIIFGGVGGAAIDALTGRLVMNSRHVHAEQATPTP